MGVEDSRSKHRMSGLTSEQTDEIKAAFALFDHGQGTISSTDAVIAMKSLGQGTPALWAKAKRDADANGGAVSQTYFLTLMNNMMANDNLDDLLSAFRCLDKRDEGSIDIETFRRVMQSLGNAKLSSREVDAMLEVGGVEGHRLRYE